jgi:hypothetical protein
VKFLRVLLSGVVAVGLVGVVGEVMKEPGVVQQVIERYFRVRAGELMVVLAVRVPVLVDLAMAQQVEQELP